MSRRERRSVSLGRHRDRGSRDSSKPPPEEDLSTRHNISNFLLTLQRIQASEEENRQLRKENQLLRQRARSSRLSSSSFRGHSSFESSEQTTILPDAEDEIIAADVKRNSLLFVGDSIPPSPEHAALEVQYKKLQEDFETVKEFLKHLFQHALTLSSNDGLSSPYKAGKDKENTDINTYNPAHSKQLERSLDDIHGQISQLRNSQDQQQVKMEQVQQALDNVLCQSSVRNDVTMRMVRQQDKMKEITRHIDFLETQLMALTVSLRQAEERSRQTSVLKQTLDNFVAANSKNLKGNTKEELYKIAGQLSQLGRLKSTCQCKMAVVTKMVNHVTVAANQGQTLGDSKPPADVIDAMSKLQRLIGSDWHRLGRMLGLNSDCLDDIGKFTNFDLTSRVEKVVTQWARQTRGASVDGLKQGLDKMDRDILLVAEQPVCKEWWQLPPEVNTYVIAHVIDVPSLVSYLASQGMLSQDSRNFILDTPQEHRRACRLLHTVVYMGLETVQMLCTALDSLKQTLVANKIRGYFPNQLTNGDSRSPPSSDLDNNNKSSPYSDLTATATKQRQTTASRTPDTGTPSKASTLTNSKSGEKQRKKRSRSLFTRKNKLRDSENDAELAMDMRGEYNYYYPPVNRNVLNSSSSGSGSFGREEDVWRKEDLPPPGPKRQYGRQNRHAQVINSSGEVIV